MSKANPGQSGPAGWRRCCLSLAAALLLAGCAAQNAYRDAQTLLAEDKVDAGLAKIQEAMALDPASAEYRIAYVRAQDRYLNASLGRAERAFIEARYDEAEGTYRRAAAFCSPVMTGRWPACDRSRARAGTKSCSRKPKPPGRSRTPSWLMARLRTILAANPKHERALRPATTDRREDRQGCQGVGC